MDRIASLWRPAGLSCRHVRDFSDSLRRRILRRVGHHNLDVLRYQAPEFTLRTFVVESRSGPAPRKAARCPQRRCPSIPCEVAVVVHAHVLAPAASLGGRDH